nr:coat protein [Miscanthus virus M]
MSSSSSSSSTSSSSTSEEFFLKKAKEAFRKRVEGEFDGSSLSSSFGTAQLETLELRLNDNSVMTEVQAKVVAENFKAMGVESSKVFGTAIELAFLGRNDGASDKIETSEMSKTCSKPIIDLLSAIESVCTFRQFCSYYAKVVWAIQLQHKSPPPKWQRWGFTRETRYAAFDFFPAVSSPAALEPKIKCRKPTMAEIVAFNTRKELTFRRIRREEGNFTNTDYEVTAGELGMAFEGLPRKQGTGA